EARARVGADAALRQVPRLQSGDGDAAGAVASLQKARALAPNSEEVLRAIAQLALAARPPGAAARAPRTRGGPKGPRSHTLRAIAARTAGNSARATEALQAADRLQPGRPLTL